MSDETNKGDGYARADVADIINKGRRLEVERDALREELDDAREVVAEHIGSTAGVRLGDLGDAIGHMVNQWRDALQPAVDKVREWHGDDADKVLVEGFDAEEPLDDLTRYRASVEWLCGLGQEVRDGYDHQVDIYGRLIEYLDDQGYTPTSANDEIDALDQMVSEIEAEADNAHKARAELARVREVAGEVVDKYAEVKAMVIDDRSHMRESAHDTLSKTIAAYRERLGLTEGE